MTHRNINMKVKRAAKKMLVDGFSLVNAYEEVKVLDPNLSYNDFRNWAHDKLGWRVTWRKLHSEKVNPKRHDLIETMKTEAIEHGLSLQAIGDRHGISRERVRQILDKEGINVRELKKDYYKSLAPKLYDIQKSTGCVDKEAADKLNISSSILASVKKYLTSKQKKEIEAARKNKIKVDALVKYAPAIKMWEEHMPVEAIAKHMKKIYPENKWTTESMNQVIIRLRRKYGVFPKRQGASS